MVSVYTVGEICKKCYSCVRTCPTKAIEVHGGQAVIIEQKCISCGYCVNRCSQNAKRVRSSLEPVTALLAAGGAESTAAPVYAMVAPSFPAAFLDLEPESLVGALKAAGFREAFEVAFGADLVSYAYYQRFRRRMADRSVPFLISTPCPAVVSYVEKVFPDLVPYLADVMSPMEAMARVIRETIDPNGRIVFIGPCVAKKDEIRRLGLVDEVLTFHELEELFRQRSIDPRRAEPAPFHPPQANLGRIYPVTGGLLKAASIDADLLESPVFVVEGRDRVTEILEVLSRRLRGGIPVVNRLFDLLFCEGCIGGPMIPNELSFYERKRYIVDYMKNHPRTGSIEEWAAGHRQYLALDISKRFAPLKVEEPVPDEEEIRRILAKTNKLKPEDELNCQACGYASCREKAIAVYRGIAEVEMCLPYLIAQLEKTILDLKSNQARLIQAEKLASMGQMAAGIAHEINNPLGVVLMYAYLLKDELASEGQPAQDVEKVIQEAERTRKIVRGILNFARQEKVDRKPTDINRLVEAAAAGLPSIDEDGRIEVHLELDESVGEQMVDPHQLRQVLDNLLKNAVEVMPKGGTITIRTEQGRDEFAVHVADSGPGIPEDVLPRLFSPFFTTKAVGQGTGLGLAVCYGIVKMHGGSIQAANDPGGGAHFTIRIRHYRREE